MKKKFIGIAIFLLLFLIINPFAYAEVLQSFDSYNENMQNYIVNSSGYNSYLFENEDGTLSRLDEIEEVLFVEIYNSSFQIQKRILLANELEYWIGAFSSKSANYLFFGAKNPQVSDTAEIIRIVKYSKDWVRIDDLSIYGNNTRIPSHSSNLRCAESGDYIFVHTGHMMYSAHQANMTFSFSQSKMELMNIESDVSAYTGYTSHSFNQFILINDQDEVVTIDHGDAYPRALMMTNYHNKSDTGIFSLPRIDNKSNIYNIYAQNFVGAIGNNNTGASVGGFTQTTKGYLISYNYDNGGEEKRTPYIAYCPNDGYRFIRKKIHVDCEGTPIIVPIDKDKGYVMLSDTNSDKIYYATYAANGDISAINEATGKLSTCQPIIYNGKATWYSASYSQPVFYQLDENGITSFHTELQLPFIDIGEETNTTIDAIRWALVNNVTTGTSDTTFSPKSTCTRGQVLTFLWRAKGNPEPTSTYNPFTDISPSDYHYKAILWGVENGITTGTSNTTFSPDNICKTEHIITFIWRASGKPASTGNINYSWVEREPDAYYSVAMDWAYENRLLDSTSYYSANTPASLSPRANVITYIYKLISPEKQIIAAKEKAALIYSEPTRQLSGIEVDFREYDKPKYTSTNYGFKDLRFSNLYAKPSQPIYFDTEYDIEAWGGIVPEITYTLEDNSIARIEGNYVYAIKTGITSLTATATLPSGREVKVSRNIACISDQDIGATGYYGNVNYDYIDENEILKNEQAIKKIKNDSTNDEESSSIFDIELEYKKELEKYRDDQDDTYPISKSGLVLLPGKRGSYYGYSDNIYEEYWKDGSYFIMKLNQNGTIQATGMFTKTGFNNAAVVFSAGGVNGEASVPYVPNEIFNLSSVTNVSHLKENIGDKLYLFFMLCNNYKKNSNVYGGISNENGSIALLYDGTKLKFSIIVDTR